MSQNTADSQTNTAPAGNSALNSRMATVKLPDRLSLGSAAIKNWKLFKQRWSTYSVITDLPSLPQEKQRAFFIHCLDDDALEAFNTFQLADDADIDDIVSAFDRFIIGETNVTYERFVFNKRVQEEALELIYYQGMFLYTKKLFYCLTFSGTNLKKERRMLSCQNS